MRVCYPQKQTRHNTLTAHIQARDVIASSLAALLMTLPALGLAADKAPAAQLTIHVDASVLQSGGTVLVVSNPISTQEWDKLPTRQAQVPAPQTSSKLKPGDKEFDATISSKVSIVEFVYPEGGTFGFKLRATENGAAFPPLRSKRILVGGGYYTDKATGQKIEWNDVSVIHIDGPEVDERFSRLVRASSSEIMNTGPARTQQAGVTVYAPSAAQLEKALIKEPQ